MVQHLVKLRSFQESKREMPLPGLNCKCNTKRVHPVSYGNVKPKMPAKGITFDPGYKNLMGMCTFARIKDQDHEVRDR